MDKIIIELDDKQKALIALERDWLDILEQQYYRYNI